MLKGIRKLVSSDEVAVLLFALGFTRSMRVLVSCLREMSEHQDQVFQGGQRQRSVKRSGAVRRRKPRPANGRPKSSGGAVTPPELDPTVQKHLLQEVEKKP